MALPTTRTELKDYCLRKLGAPVIEINVADPQVEDRIDEALQYYYDYHFDGSEKVYYKHQLSADDITNEYITLPENIMGVVKIFDLGQAISTGSNLFNIRYQIALNDLYTLTSQSLVPYWMAFEQLQFMEQILVGKQPIRYNRHTDRLHIDMDWEKVKADDYLVVEAYQVVDPEVYSDAYSDRWLLRYTTALIKKQWGQNLIKFEGMQLPGNVTFNGRQIYDDAENELAQLEQEMIVSYSLPVTDMIG